MRPHLAWAGVSAAYGDPANEVGAHAATCYVI